MFCIHRSPVQTSNKKFQEDDDDSSLSNGGIGSSKKLKPSSSNDDLNTAVNFKGVSHNQDYEHV